MNKKKEIKKGVLILVFYTTVYCLLSMFDVEKPYVYFSACVYIQFLYTYWGWKTLTKSWIDSYMVFTIALYVFTLGHAFLDPFDAVSEGFNFITSYGIKPYQYLEAEYISLFFLLSFHFGAIIGLRINKNVKNRLRRICEVIALKKVGLYCLIFSLPFYIYNIINKIKIILQSGYMGLYDEANIKYGGFAAFARLVSDLYVPSIICILVYAEITKKYRLPLYLLAFVTVCIPPFFLGSRTNAVIMVGIIFLIYYFYNTITRKQVVIFVSVVYMLLLSLIFIRYSRQMQDVNDTAEVVESINNKGDSNPITSMISEMGWSLYPVIKTIEIKEEPNEHFLYGTSILWGMTSVFPNLFWDIHPAKMYADMSDWITKKLRFSYGIGYSLVAEAYANFGFLGFIFLFFVSVLFMKLFNYSTLMNKSNLILQVCSLIFLWFVIRIVRNNFMDTFRSLVFFVLPFFFMIKYYANRYKKTLLIKNRRKRINKAIRQFT